MANAKRISAFIWRYLCSIISCFYLITIGMFFSRNRDLLVRICSHFGLAGKKIRPILPRISIPKLFPDTPDIRIEEPIAADGNISLLELVIIVTFIRHYQPTTIFEIGTFDGRTSLNLAANAPPAARIFTLDLPSNQVDTTDLPIVFDDRALIEKQRSGGRFEGTNYDSIITQLYGDSAGFDFSPYLSGMDFIFIDGSHSYEYVLNDSKKALSLLRDGRGIILWHDYDGFEGVTRGLNELYGRDKDFNDLRHIAGTSLAYLIKV